jgi:hypothetical protein
MATLPLAIYLNIYNKEFLLSTCVTFNRIDCEFSPLG